MAQPIHTDLAAAAELRSLQSEPKLSAAQLLADHERRQAFRRLVDPGIFRPNSKEQALSSLKTLLTIAENLLKEPDNPKYQQFKPTNSIIKRDLVDPKGALEYAIALGFRPEVVKFQPYYTFNPKHMEDLRVGAAVIREVLGLQTEKLERQARAKSNEKAVAQAAAEKVKLQFMDDRKTKMEKDDREKQVREARAALAAAKSAAALEASSEPEELSDPDTYLGPGHVLGKRDEVDNDSD